MLELFLLLVEMPKNWKPDVRESVYQVLCDQLYIQPEDMNDDLNFEEALQNGPGDRDLMFAALYSRFHIHLHEIDGQMGNSGIVTVGQLVDYIYERF